MLESGAGLKHHVGRRSSHQSEIAIGRERTGRGYERGAVQRDRSWSFWEVAANGGDLRSRSAAVSPYRDAGGDKVAADVKRVLCASADPGGRAPDDFRPPAPRLFIGRAVACAAVRRIWADIPSRHYATITSMVREVPPLITTWQPVELIRRPPLPLPAVT